MTNKTYTKTIDGVVLLLLALGVPLTLLPLQAPWGFERSVLLVGVFLALVAWRVVSAALGEAEGHKSYKSYRTYTALAAALPVAAILAAPNPEARWSLLTNLELWAAVAGILVGVVLPVAAGLAVPRTERSSGTGVPARENGRPQGSRLPVFALGVLIAAIGLISPIGPIGPIKQGLDYKTSLGITSKTLQKEPLWGVGPGKFGESFLRYKAADFNSREDWVLRYNGSQSGLLELATEYGLIGLIGPIGLIGLILADLQRKREQLSKPELYLRGGLLGVTVASLILLPYSPGVFWVLAILMNRSYKTNKTNRTNSERTDNDEI